MKNNEEWKLKLRSNYIKGLSGTGIEIREAQEYIGYCYSCLAPASLYKYCGNLELAYKNLINRELWYSAPCNFNDVFDCDISIDKTAIYNSFVTSFPSRPIHKGSYVWKIINCNVNKFLKDITEWFNDRKKDMGVLCLSECCDSLLMWAHYANNHKGICIEYDMMSINKDLGYTPVPIIYSNARACINHIDFDNPERDTLEAFLNSLTSKSVEWSYEREWRIIREDSACNGKWDYNKRGALLKMVKPISIILGCAISESYEEKIKEFCNENRINLYKMEKHKDIYKLIKREILYFDN